LEGESEGVEGLLRARVVLGAAALVLDGAVPVQGEALERTQHLVRATGDYPRRIEIFHPKEPTATAAAGVEEAAHRGDQEPRCSDPVGEGAKRPT